MPTSQKHMVFAQSIIKDAFSRPIVKLLATVSGTNDTQAIQELLRAKGPVQDDSLQRRPLYVEAPTADEALKKIESRLKAGALSPLEMGKLMAFVPTVRTTGMSSIADMIFLPY